MRNRVAFATAFIEAFLYWALLAGLSSISIWSFAQTWQFTNNGGAVSLEMLFDISFWLAIVIQYSQNAFLFLAFVSKNQAYKITDKISINIRYIYMLGWLVTSAIDAGTNVGQWRTDYPDLAATLNVYSITWQLICIGCIFVEELFIKVAGITLHKTNELFVSMGFGGFDTFWLPELLDDKMSKYGMPKNEKHSFNPSREHAERLMRELELDREKNPHKPSVGLPSNSKKKGTWKPGMPGRPPKHVKHGGSGNKDTLGKLEKILGNEVSDE